jgi:hypothetical protein
MNFLYRSAGAQQGNTGQLRRESFAVNKREQEAVDMKEFYADKVAVVTGGAPGIARP